MRKKNISRRQFLTGGASVIFGALMGKLSEHAYAEEESEKTSREKNINAGTEERDWDELPLDTLSGAYLVSDPESELFGGTVEAKEYLLTQYFHVYPGLELMLTDTGEDSGKGGWVGFSKDLKPNAVLRTDTPNAGTEKKTLVSVPEGVYYLRGSGKALSANPRAWVKNFSLYSLNCGLIKPDLSSYLEITDLSLNQQARKEVGGYFDENIRDCPSISDMFYTPIGTDIILTFNNANIAPYIYESNSYMVMNKKNIFERHYNFGFSWYHCKTTDICNYLGAYYETVNSIAKTLTVDELRLAEPHLYIRFPSKVTNTLWSAKIRTKGVSLSYDRLFTVVHITDTHGDADSTHAAFEFADQIKADFVALTGDYVPYGPDHGYNILHSIIRNAKTPTVYSVGNHDVIKGSDQLSYVLNIAPIRDILHASKEHPYYFRDFRYDEEVVRAISLYPFYEGSKSKLRGYYTQEQLMWLCDVMMSAPDKSHIFILRHFSHHRPILYREEQGMFYDFPDSISDEPNLWLDMKCDAITEIVDAYKTKSQIFSQYTGELQDRDETITVKYDFTKRPNSEFVAYFSGHTHQDSVGYARGTKTEQMVLNSLCTIGVKGSVPSDAYTYTYTPRDYGTDSQIALNVFSFDFRKKRIYVARVGNKLFKDREKTFMELSY